MISPFMKWAGSKTGELNDFKSYIPKQFDTYVEPFVGGGSVFFYLKSINGLRCKKVINDAHEDLINLYNQIKLGNAQRIVDLCHKSKVSAEEYYRIRDDYVPTNDVERAFRFYYRSLLCFRGMTRYNSKGEFNIPCAFKKNTPEDKLPKIDWSVIADPQYRDYLTDTEIRLGSFDVVMKEFDAPNTFMFLDPPYDSEFKNYYLDFGKKEHEKLAEIFHQSKSQLIMVIAETPLITSLYKDNIIGHYVKTYRFRIRKGRLSDDQINKTHLIIGKNVDHPVEFLDVERRNIERLAEISKKKKAERIVVKVTEPSPVFFGE